MPTKYVKLVVLLVMGPNAMGQELYYMGGDIEGNRAVFRSNLDGTGRQSIVTIDDVPVPNCSQLSGSIGLDPVAKKLYWTAICTDDKSGDGTVMLRSNLDGSGTEVIIDRGVMNGIANHIIVHRPRAAPSTEALGFGANSHFLSLLIGGSIAWSWLRTRRNTMVSGTS